MLSLREVAWSRLLSAVPRHVYLFHDSHERVRQDPRSQLLDVVRKHGDVSLDVLRVRHALALALRDAILGAAVDR
jgi:hypothetical protein